MTYAASNPSSTLLGRIFRLIGIIIWNFCKPFWYMLRWLWQYTIMVLSYAVVNTVVFTRTRWNWFFKYEPLDGWFGMLVDKYVGRYMHDPFVRVPFALGSLIIGVPGMFLMTLAIGFGIPVAICLAIDQYTYPTHELAEQFRPNGPYAAKTLTPEEKGVLVTDALVYQLEYELNSDFGWTPNDCAGWCPLAWPRFFDNRQHRQLGVIYAVHQFTNVWSRETSKLGVSDRESKDLVEARQRGFAISPYDWFFPSAEVRYKGGIDKVRAYQRKLLAGFNDANINVTTKNLVGLISALKDDVLAEPYGRLIDRNRVVAYSELDNAVYYAQGAAIVARDILSALSVAYARDLDRGEIAVNITHAIDSLDAMTHFNPLVIMRGDGDAMVADHRSKIGRYMSEAINRLDDIAKALQN